MKHLSFNHYNFSLRQKCQTLLIQKSGFKKYHHSEPSKTSCCNKIARDRLDWCRKGSYYRERKAVARGNPPSSVTDNCEWQQNKKFHCSNWYPNAFLLVKSVKPVTRDKTATAMSPDNFVVVGDTKYIKDSYYRLVWISRYLFSFWYTSYFMSLVILNCRLFSI